MLTSMLSANSPAWLLVFARMGGLLGMTPLFARRNVPSTVRAGLVFLMTALIAPTVTVTGLPARDSLALVVAMLKELFVGFACGYVFQIYYYMLFFAGDILDTHFGMSMAKVFDPGTNIQMSVSGTLLNLLFVMYIFATDSHLLLIRIFAGSFQVLPAGAVVLGPDIWEYFIQLFISAFSMAIRLALPFMAAEFVLELSMGVLMKLIPQIHIFVINIQFKMLLGMLLLLAFAAPVASFTDNYMRLMLENLQTAMAVLGGASPGPAG